MLDESLSSMLEVAENVGLEPDHERAAIGGSQRHPAAFAWLGYAR